MGNKLRGMYKKFDVIRTDGESAPDKKHHNCPYFVLDLHHDPYSHAALKAYADACRDEYPLLAADIDKQIWLTNER